MPDAATATPDPTNIDDYLSSRGMMTYPQIDKRREELIGQFEQVGAKETAAIDRGAAARDRLMAGGIRAPGAPKLQDVPKPPDQQFQDPFQAFGSPAVFLAALGSLFTRHPLKVALDAGAAAMKGFHEGDQQRMEEARERWREATQVAVDQNKIELEKYNAAWKATEHSVSERQAKMQAIAAGTQDEVMKAAIASGNLDRVWHMLDARQNANDKLQETLIRERDRQEALKIQRDRLAAQTGQSLSPETLRRMAEQYLAGDTTVKQNMARGISGPGDLRAFQEAVTALAQERGMDGKAVADKIAEFVGEKAGERTAGTREANLKIILRVTDAAIPAALAASEEVGRTGWVPINRIIQKGEVIASDPKLKRFGMANLQLAEGWARAMNPTGVMRESDRDMALSFLSTADSPETYKQAVQQLRTQIEREYSGVVNKTDVGPGSRGPTAGKADETKTDNGVPYYRIGDKWFKGTPP